MNKKHEKSACCSARIRLFGTRRRQCSLCKKTWRVWQKKRGRKEARLKEETLVKYFKGNLKNKNLEKRTLSARLRSLLYKFNQNTPWPSVPDGNLVAVADGLIQYFGKEKYTIYFILVRSTSGSKAFILPPYLRKEGEISPGWREAFAQIPSEVFVRIKALACDGHTGLINLAKANGWVLQRCHYHLLARVAHCSSTGFLGQNSPLGRRVRNLMEVVLYNEDHAAVFLAIGALERVKLEISSNTFRGVVSGFIKNHEDYRSYLNFPQYRLPATSNTAESLNSLIRELQYRARGFKTPHSFFAWIVGFCKHRKFINCHPRIQPN